MFRVVFTLDYEIYGNGEGSPLSLMVAPTNKILDLFDQYGAKLTIMADFAEILKFKEYLNNYDRDDYYYNAIAEQLKHAIKTGHDVQLHVHSSYLNATYENGRWKQDWSEYNLAGLSYKRIEETIRMGKSFLEDLLRPVKPSYKCFAFRTANWSVSPSLNLVRALVKNNIIVDTSVFKFGKRNGLVNFDYTEAFSDLIPWPIDENNVCRRASNGNLLEFPIYCENQHLWKFISPLRFFNAFQETRHPVGLPKGGNSLCCDGLRSSCVRKPIHFFMTRHAWKMDFNQCTGRQLIQALKRAESKYSYISKDLPFVLMGHSKIFNSVNSKLLRPFLRYIAENNHKYAFSTFEAFDLAHFRNNVTALYSETRTGFG
jgi:hypothetical protein